MKIVFFGCDDFAAVNLKRLLDDGHKVVGLVTQPDRPKGRGMRVVYSPTKTIAIDHGINVCQPASLADPQVIERLVAFDADLFIVIAYGQFLPQSILDLPKYFCLNVHGSLLPKYRGAAPINWAIINGEAETGISIIRLNAGMDAGDILVKAVCPIPEDMTSIELRAKLAQLGAEKLSSLIRNIRSGNYDVEEQDKVFMTRAPKMHKDLGHIHWTYTARQIHDLVRGVQPWPGAFTYWRGKRLKILDAVAAEATIAGKPGEIVELHKDGFYVQAADREVLVRRLHLESSKPMDARAFLAGHRLSVGEMLG